MKNIHLFQTDTPSRLYKNISGELSFTDITFEQGNGYNTNQHVYITSEEKIEVAEWGCHKNTTYDNYQIIKCNTFNKESIQEHWGKIILTTDPDLIADGVQAIDSKFLEWFIINSNCNKVDIDLVPVNEFGSEITVNGYGFDKFIYKVIIPSSDMKNPKKEPAQETLEKAAKNWITKNSGIKSLLTPEFVRETFKEGAKWQQEQDSKELAMWKLTVEKQEAKCKELRGIISDLQERSISREAYEDSLSMQKCSNAGYESKITELQEGSYSEEEVYNLLYQLLPDKQELNEWFSQNKKK